MHFLELQGIEVVLLAGDGVPRPVQRERLSGLPRAGDAVGAIGEYTDGRSKLWLPSEATFFLVTTTKRTTATSLTAVSATRAGDPMVESVPGRQEVTAGNPGR